MPDYKTMYYTLFRSISQAVSVLEEAQKETEEMFLSAPEPDLTALRPEPPKDG